MNIPLSYMLRWMMERISANYHTLQVLNNAKTKLIRAIISEGGKELINSINECVLNVLVGNIPLSTCLRRKLKKYKFGTSPAD